MWRVYRNLPAEFGEESLIEFECLLRPQTKLKLFEEGYQVLSGDEFDGFGAVA